MAIAHRFRSGIATGMAMLLTQLAPVPVYAVNVQQGGLQILDPSGVCASWSWGGTPANPTVTCNAATPPVAGAPVCTLTASPPSLSAAGSVTLTANCTLTDTATTWAWTGPGTNPSGTGAAPQSQILTVSAPTNTFTVRATNGSGTSTQKSVTVTVGTPPPPSGGLPSTCGNMPVVQINRDGPDILFQPDTHVVSSMSASTVAMGRFTTGNAGQDTASLKVTDWAGENYGRKIYVSTTPCDFNSFSTNSAKSVYFYYAVGATGLGSFYKMLQPNTTYYIMVTMPTCSAGANCGFLGSFTKPAN